MCHFNSSTWTWQCSHSCLSSSDMIYSNLERNLTVNVNELSHTGSIALGSTSTKYRNYVHIIVLYDYTWLWACIWYVCELLVRMYVVLAIQVIIPYHQWSMKNTFSKRGWRSINKPTHCLKLFFQIQKTRWLGCLWLHSSCWLEWLWDKTVIL